jgi:hypothetical protein
LPRRRVVVIIGDHGSLTCKWPLDTGSRHPSSDDTAPRNFTEPYLTGARDPVQQQFTVGKGIRLIYTAPQPARVELPTRADLRYTTEVRDVMNISVIRPFHVLHRGDTYTATSLMTNATAGQLRAAGTEYPPYVQNLYFYISPSVTDRTIQLAHDIVGGQPQTLRPVGRWRPGCVPISNTVKLFPSRHVAATRWIGCCSMSGRVIATTCAAMIVMLRSLGIPARMAADLQGRGTLRSRRLSYRSGTRTPVEVYFPLRWIRTPGPPINRVDEAPAALSPGDALPRPRLP